MTRLGPLLAAGAAAVLVLSACGPGDDPKPNFSSVTPTASGSSASPSPTGSQSPSVPTTGPNVSPGEVPPTEPTAASSDTQDGAIGFVTYYIKTLDWVYATSRPDLLNAFYAATCSTCESGQKFIRDLVSRGSITGGRVSIKKIGIVANDARGGAQYAISANISVDAASVVSADGAVATSFPATPDVTLTEWVSWQGSSWRIVEERYA